jgi:hypothetical protein
VRILHLAAKRRPLPIPEVAMQEKQLQTHRRYKRSLSVTLAQAACTSWQSQIASSSRACLVHAPFGVVLGSCTLRGRAWFMHPSGSCLEERRYSSSRSTTQVLSVTACTICNCRPVECNCFRSVVHRGEGGSGFAARGIPSVTSHQLRIVGESRMRSTTQPPSVS